MRRTPISERIDVRGNGVKSHTVQLCPLNQELRIVNPLSSGKDFFSTHEHVVAVAVPCICGVWHCIEGSHRKRELVEDEEVSVVFGFHQAAEKLFTGSGQVLFIAHLHSGLLQHLYCLGELQSKGRIEEPEWLMGKLSRHSLDLVLEVVPQPPKDACKQIPNSVNHLMVMIFERHLQVEAHELCEMSVCVGIFCTEDSTHSEHLVEVGGDGHLLVQLRRLSEEGGALEVVHLEHVGSSLGGGADDLRRVDLDEAALGQRVAEESAHSGLESEDGLVGRRAQVEHAVVQPGVLVHLCEVALLIVGDPPSRILNLQRQLGVARRNNPHLFNVQLDVLLTATLNFLLDFGDNCFHINDALLGDVSGELDHLLTHILTDVDQTLHAGCLLAEDDEALLAFCPACVQTSSHCHCFPVQLQPKFFDVGDDSGQPLLGHVHLLNAVFPLRDIRTFIFALILSTSGSSSLFRLVGGLLGQLLSLFGVALLLCFGLLSISWSLLLWLLVLLLLLALALLRICRTSRFPVEPSGCLEVCLEPEQHLHRLVDLGFVSLRRLQGADLLSSCGYFGIKLFCLAR